MHDLVLAYKLYEVAGYFLADLAVNNSPLALTKVESPAKRKSIKIWPPKIGSSGRLPHREPNFWAPYKRSNCQQKEPASYHLTYASVEPYYINAFITADCMHRFSFIATYALTY